MPPGPLRPPPMTLPHDHELEEAEDTQAGDFLDYITPAVLAKTRFKQHHLWLEEILSSVYSINNILPEDMGFGLVGELGELTRDLLNPPNPKLREKEERDVIARASHEAAPKDDTNVYKHLEEGQFEEFEKRVAEFVAKKEKEVDELREQHTKNLARIQKGRSYLDAEARIREAGLDSEKVDQIIRDVELEMGISLLERKDVVLVQRGGLVDEEPQKVNGDSNEGASSEEQPLPDQPDVDVDHDVNTAATLLDEFTATPDFGNVELEADEKKAEATPAAKSDEPGMDLIDDGMDLDVELPAADSTTAETLASKTDEDWVVVDKSQQEPNPEPAPEPAKTSTPKPAEPEATGELQQQSIEAGEATPADDDVLQPESMFDGADFSAFDDNMESGSYEAEDALLDFVEGGFDSGNGTS
jgi:hypothetical protein